MSTLLHYRYFQPADGSHFYPGPNAADPGFRLIYAGVLPVDGFESIPDVLARIMARHGSRARPEGPAFRPVGTGDVVELGERGLWRILPVGFQELPLERLRLADAA